MFEGRSDAECKIVKLKHERLKKYVSAASLSE